MLLNLSAFSGEIPRLAADALPTANAQLARDCEFAYGDLRGVLGDAEALTTTQTIRGLYLHGPTSRWYSWASDVDAVQGPIVEDQYQRFYYTIPNAGLYVSQGDIGGSGVPPSVQSRVGVPTPTTAPTREDDSTVYPAGVAGYTFKAFCAGDTSTPTEVASYLTEDVEGSEYSLTVTGTCGTVASTGSTTYHIGEAYSSDNTTERYEVLSTQDGASVSSGTLFFKLSRGALDGNPTVLTLNVVNTAGTSNVQRTFTLQTSGWYTTNGYLGPTAATEAEAATLSFEITVTLDSGDPIKLAVPLSSPVYLPADIGDGKWRVTMAKQSATVFKFYVNAGGFTESRAYVFTYVNTWGEESSPSPPTIVDVVPGIPVSLSLLYSMQVGYRSIDRIRVYRTATGSQTTEYQFVDEINSLPTEGSLVGYVDSVESSKLGEVLSTLGYEPPPAYLTGLIALPNGILCAFKGAELWFSEPYLPYAWKAENSMSFPNAIVGIAAYENSIFVTTTANPWLVNGVSPDSMSQAMLPEIQAGVSKNSIVQTGNNVAYLSHDGIVLARGMDTSVGQTLQLFTRKAWRDRYGAHLSHARLSAHDGALICTFDNGAEGFILRTDEATGAFSRYSAVVNATHVWPATDWLYFAKGVKVYAHKADPNSMAFTWQSKDVILPKPHNFGCCQVRGSGSVTFQFYADGVLKHTKAITLTEKLQMFRLPAGFVAARWSVKITGSTNAIVKQVLLATSPKELQSAA